MKLLSAIIAATCAMTALAETSTAASTNSTVASTNSAAGANTRLLKRAAVLRATGGRLLMPGSGKGVFAFANAQSRLPQNAIQDLANRIQTDTMIEIRVVANSDEMGTETLKKLGAQMGVSIVDAPGKPTLVVAPEEGWAVVNVAKLGEGKDGAANFAKRVRKEIYRAFGMVAGGCGSSYQGNLLDPIRSPDDLDMYPESDLQMPIDMLQKMPKFCERFGVKPWRMTTYRRACHEGWAPPPKDEYQKAIWDKVHALPTEPLKIAPEAKKVKD